ncbi:MAG: hypothetical protein Q8K78_12370, partial [Planctomycetaceae bacterium]|nr:hypothetical protein [Planctomycetaceae bacterium]
MICRDRISLPVKLRDAFLFIVTVLSVISTSLPSGQITAEENEQSSSADVEVQSSNSAASGDEVGNDPLPERAVFRLGTERFRQEGEVKRVQYFRDGKRLASISRNAILIWDAQTGQRLRQFRCKDNPQHSWEFTGMAISPD